MAAYEHVYPVYHFMRSDVFKLQSGFPVLDHQFPVIFFSGVIGVWLFYIQHQFEGVYWSRHEQWDPTKASLYGSSFYRLPAVIQWFTGNIWLHHIHHLRAMIPNYNLQRACGDAKSLLKVNPLTIRKSIACLLVVVDDSSWGQRASGGQDAKVTLVPLKAKYL